jgi:hypothetical protein
MSLMYYRLFNLASLTIGISIGFYTTNYFLYSPKKEEEDTKTIHISEFKI